MLTVLGDFVFNSFICLFFRREDSVLELLICLIHSIPVSFNKYYLTSLIFGLGTKNQDQLKYLVNDDLYDVAGTIHARSARIANKQLNIFKFISFF